MWMFSGVNGVSPALYHLATVAVEECTGGRSPESWKAWRIMKFCFVLQYIWRKTACPVHHGQRGPEKCPRQRVLLPLHQQTSTDPSLPGTVGLGVGFGFRWRLKGWQLWFEIDLWFRISAWMALCTTRCPSWRTRTGGESVAFSHHLSPAEDWRRCVTQQSDPLRTFRKFLTLDIDSQAYFPQWGKRGYHLCSSSDVRDNEDTLSVFSQKSGEDIRARRSSRNQRVSTILLD